MQLTQEVLTAVNFLLCCMKDGGGGGGLKDPAWGWVRIMYCATEFNTAMCTGMAYRAENDYRSLGSLFTIRS